jgi:hypothetical protein
MKWEPKMVHIVMGGRLCGAKERAWPEHCLDNEWSRHLPICEDCKIEYKRQTGRDYNSTPRPMKTERVGGLYLIDFGARSNKGTSEGQ